MRGGLIMAAFEDQERSEYAALMKRGNDAERTGQICWTAGGLAAAVMLSWGIADKNPGLMIPVVFAIAVGFYALLRGRQQVRWIGSYVENFCEEQKGPQWFTRLHRLQSQPGYRTVGDWLTVSLANAGVVLALVLAWVYSSAAPRGDLLAGIATTCGVLFGFHSISETVRMSQTDWVAQWRQVGGELKEVPREKRAASW
jgi:Flp pilus assembly protein TadB